MTASRNGALPLDARTAAELYLALGLAPIPMPPRSKDPGYAGWQDLRLTTDALDKQFPLKEARNIGILNGAPSMNVLDVDLDCREASAAAPLLLPPTGWIFGRKSAPWSHRIYRTDRPFEAAQEKYADLSGAVLVELRGTGGITVCPPSTHRDTGERIVWESFTTPGDVTLTALQQAVREVAAVALLARHWVWKGTRQDAFLALVGGLLRAGWTQEHVERFVEALAMATLDDEVRKRVQVVDLTVGKQEQDRRTTGWPRLAQLIGPTGEEVLRRVRKWLGIAEKSQVAETKKRAVRTLAPYRPFPVEALPNPLAEYVRQGALALGCDPAYLALPALAAMASVIGNTRTIRLKRGWEEPCIIWSAIVGDSGTLKTPAYLRAVAHLFRLQRKLMLAHKEAMNQYDEELAKYNAAKKEAKKGGTDPGDPPDKPVLRRLVCSDTTIEKLAEILEDNPRGILVARDELAGWIGSFCRYKGKQGGTDLPNWLEMFRAGTVVVDRKTGERRTLFIQHAAASVTGGIQPGILAHALTTDLLDAGLAARVLMTWPPRLPKNWTEDAVAPEVEQAYQDTIDKLQGLEFDTDKDGEKVPHVLTLSPDGKAAWITFYNAWAMEQAAAEGELAAAFSKLEAYAARFALLHHVVSRAARGDDDLAPVEKESIEAGITLCRWFSTEARRIYSTLSESNEERNTRRLVEFIRGKGGQITVRKLQKSNSKKYPTADHAEAALVALVPDYGEWIETAPGPQGGRPARVLRLHSTPDTTDTTSSGEDGREDVEGSHPSDTTTDTTQPAFENRLDLQGCVGSVQCRTGESEECAPNEKGVDVAGGSVGRNGVVADGSVGHPSEAETYPALLLVDTAAGLTMVSAALDNTPLVALDIETTGLDPRTDRVRLLSLACDTSDGGTFTYLVDCFAVDPAPLFEVLAEKDMVIHNAFFDLRFLKRLGFVPLAVVHDTMRLAEVLGAGTRQRVRLADCCERWLSQTVDKTKQKSDWSGQLTDDQLTYAARDVEVLRPLLATLQKEIHTAALRTVADIEQRCQPAVVWMAGHGVAFDRDAWQGLADEAAREADRLRLELDKQPPNRPGTLEGTTTWNWDSPLQVKEVLELVGCEVESTDDNALAAIDHPLANLVRHYRAATKKVKTYGEKWLKHVRSDGRVYPEWRQRRRHRQAG